MPAAKTKTRGDGKTSFVKEMLLDNPRVTPAEVNEAWAAAGMAGTISGSLVKVTKGKLGLTKPRKKRGRRGAVAIAPAPARAYSAPVVRTGRVGRPKSQDGILAEVESDIDRLIFKLMMAGEFGPIEDALRNVRRRVVLSRNA